MYTISIYIYIYLDLYIKLFCVFHWDMGWIYFSFLVQPRAVISSRIDLYRAYGDLHTHTKQLGCR